MSGGYCLNTNYLYNLLKTIASGDRAAFRELYYEYKDRVYAYAMHFTHDKITSEEMVQELFLKLWLHREELSGIQNFEGYLRTITKNQCFDYLKKLAREQQLKQNLRNIANATEEQVESFVNCNCYEQLVQQALDRLPPRQKTIYKLSFYQGQRQEEIAEQLHISRNTVKVHLAKARSFVRKFLAARIGLIVAFFGLFPTIF